jgi:hypothetical protein
LPVWRPAVQIQRSYCVELQIGKWLSSCPILTAAWEKVASAGAGRETSHVARNDMNNQQASENESKLPGNATRTERFLAFEQHPWVRLLTKMFLVIAALSGGASALYSSYEKVFLEPVREAELFRIAAEREGTLVPPKVEILFGDGNDRCSLRNLDVRPIREAIVWFAQAQVDLTSGRAEFAFSSSREYPRAREHELLPGDEALGKWMGTGFLRDPHKLPLPGLGCEPDHDCVSAFECRSEYLRDADRRPFYFSKLAFVVDEESVWTLKSVDQFFTTRYSANPADPKSWTIEYLWKDDRIRRAFEIYSVERAVRLQFEEMFPAAESELPPLLPPTGR